MMKSVCVLAILAVASTAAVAKDRKVIAPVQMTDAEMDKVTAGAAAAAYVSTYEPGQVSVRIYNDGQAELIRYPGISVVCINGCFN